MFAEKMRTIRFHEYGEPASVLRFEEAPVPTPFNPVTWISP
ncbi:hypothetical protein [Pseudomonas syringae]|nr:hypothetical protein [Pseudomonas syringae]